VTDARCEYEAQGRDFERCTYLPARVSYVDDDLAVAVTDLARARFVACLHEHFDGLGTGPALMRDRPARPARGSASVASVPRVTKSVTPAGR
jgi:hypothetical protein